jgi:hypothetical protein
MLGNAIAAFIGHKIDASDGEGGTVGAIVGVATWKVAKTVVPAALFFGAIAYGIHVLTKDAEA